MIKRSLLTIETKPACVHDMCKDICHLWHCLDIWWHSYQLKGIRSPARLLPYRRRQLLVFWYRPVVFSVAEFKSHYTMGLPPLKSAQNNQLMTRISNDPSGRAKVLNDSFKMIQLPRQRLLPFHHTDTHTPRAHWTHAELRSQILDRWQATATSSSQSLESVRLLQPARGRLYPSDVPYIWMHLSQKIVSTEYFFYEH